MANIGTFRPLLFFLGKKQMRNLTANVLDARKREYKPFSLWRNDKS